MVKDNKNYNKNKEHIGIADISLISFGDNIFSRLNNEKTPNLNNIYDNNKENK